MPDPDAVPPALPDHVDAWWDALLRGAPPADPLAPELTGEIRRLQAADRTPHADPVFLARLQQELTMNPTTPLAAAPLPPRGFAPTANGRVPIAPSAPRRVESPPRRRWWGAVERLVAAVLVVGLIGAYVALNAGTPPAGDDAPAAELFVVGEEERIVIPLDPGTLADKNAAALVSRPMPSIAEGIGRDGYTGRWTFSADGSTMVSVEYPLSLVGFTAERMEIVVRDGLAGPERLRFNPPDFVLPDVQVSDDGSRIFAQQTAIDPLRGFPGSVDPPTWYVLDARSGRTLATIDATEPDPEHGRRFAWLSPDGNRVYRLGAGGPSSGTAPAPARLLAYDAATGDEIARLDLPDVRAGDWTTQRRIEGRPVEEYAALGHALSPDGTRLALLHDRGRIVTLVDTRRLTIDRVVPLAPDAEAEHGMSETAATPSALTKPGSGDPYLEGSVASAAFTADGRGLYVMGQETTVDATGMMTCDQDATRRIDLETGATVGRATGIAQPWAFAISTDRESVYAISPNVPDACYVPWDEGGILRRLDADTLDVLAERELTGMAGRPSIELIPRSPSGW